MSKVKTYPYHIAGSGDFFTLEHRIFLLIMPARFQFWIYGIMYGNILLLLWLEYKFPGCLAAS